MAYVRYDKLQDNPGGNKLDESTTEEDTNPTPFYVEDIIMLTNQPGFHSIKKHMATFWDERHPVWVGYKSDATTVLTDVIALPCPPYYPRFTTQGVDISDLEKPEEFPNQ